MNAPHAAPLLLEGNAYERGRAQAAACPESVAAVRAQCAARLESVGPLLACREVQDFLTRQWAYAERHDPDGLAELDGVADGFGLAPSDLMAFLHAGQLAGYAEDGCTAWAFTHPAHGALVVKNRDLRGAASLGLQRVFLHRDPKGGGRTVLCVGSLGAPGAWSSGINSDGFALVDTQVVTRDQGVGLLRYFLMTKLLRECASVAEALDMIARLDHAGGGTLVLADASGAIAAVELGHHGVAIERRRRGWIARTNHFLAPSLAAALMAEPPGPDLSIARLARLTTWLTARTTPPDVADAARLMASHDSEAGPGPCRHGGDAASSTISCAIYRCREGLLDFAHGNPCAGDWRGYTVATADGAEADGLRDRAGR